MFSHIYIVILYTHIKDLIFIPYVPGTYHVISGESLAFAPSKVDLPWHVLLAARWPIAQLMAMLGRALLMLVGEAVPNRCDEVG